MVNIVWCLAICQLWRAKWIIWWGNRENILFCINDWLATFTTTNIHSPVPNVTLYSSINQHSSIGESVWQQAETFCNISRCFFCCGSASTQGRHILGAQSVAFSSLRVDGHPTATTCTTKQWSAKKFTFDKYMSTSQQPCKTETTMLAYKKSFYLSHTTVKFSLTLSHPERLFRPPNSVPITEFAAEFLSTEKVTKSRSLKIISKLNFLSS